MVKKPLSPVDRSAFVVDHHRFDPGNARMAEPGVASVMPGSRVTMMAPVSVCHHVSTAGQLPLPRCRRSPAAATVRPGRQGHQRQAALPRRRDERPQQLGRLPPRQVRAAWAATARRVAHSRSASILPGNGRAVPGMMSGDSGGSVR